MMDSKWLSIHIPIFWYNYYHTIADGFYKVFVTLKQVTHLMDLLSNHSHRAIDSTHISPTVSYNNENSDILTKKNYELFIITESKSHGWHNRIVKAVEKAFPQPIIADTYDGKTLTCSTHGIIGISYSHFRNLYYTFVSGKVNRPKKESMKMIQEYILYIKNQYQIVNLNSTTNLTKVNVLLIKRVGNREIINLDQLHQNLTKTFGNFINVEVKDNSKHTFEQQLTYHLWADVIMVSHGADETNTLFSREGTIIIEVESSTHFEPYYLVYSHYLKLRHYMFRGSGSDKNANREIDMEKFVPFFENALCNGDSYIKNSRIKQNTTPSSLCQWIAMNRKYTSQDIDESLKNRVNIFENFDKDESLEEISGKFMI